MYYAVMTQQRDEFGQFKAKAEVPREVRSIRLTNQAWENLGRVAKREEITKADLLEKLFSSDKEVENQKVIDKEKIKILITEILEDPIVTRNGKDKGAVKRGLEALLKKLP